MNKEANSSKGWSRKNFLIGLALVGGGFIVLLLDGIFGFGAVGDSDKKVPLWFYAVEWFSVVMMIFGAVGFWLIIPAFQKWWRTKKWLTWTFLAVGIFIIFLFFIFYPLDRP